MYVFTENVSSLLWPFVCGRPQGHVPTGCVFVGNGHLGASVCTAIMARPYDFI